MMSFQSLLLYQVCFSPDIVGLSKVAPKYSKLKRNTTGLSHGTSMDGYSCISSDEHDPDDEIIFHLCELHNRQNSEWPAILDSASEARYQNYLEIDSNQNEQVVQVAEEVHNCFQASCGDGQMSEDQKGLIQYHLYEAEIENSPFWVQKSDGRGKEPFLNPEVALKTAMKYLTGFTLSSVFCSVSYKGVRESMKLNFFPVLSLVILIISILLVLFFFIKALHLRSLAEDHQTPMLTPIFSLFLIFFSSHILFSFSLSQFVFLLISSIGGGIFYVISICRKI